MLLFLSSSMSFSYSQLSLLICASFPFLSYSPLVPLSISLLSLLLPSLFLFFLFFFFSFVSLFLLFFFVLFSIISPFFFSSSLASLSPLVFIKGEKGERELLPLSSHSAGVGLLGQPPIFFIIEGERQTDAVKEGKKNLLPLPLCVREEEDAQCRSKQYRFELFFF